MKKYDMITDHLFETSQAILKSDYLDFEKVINILIKVREENGFVWLVGNGGSAATASHFANDLNKACGMKAVSIVDLVSLVTAYGNDDGWHKMFSHVLKSYQSQIRDVLVIFSCSGNSGNVVEVAREWGMKNPLIVFTGNDRASKLVQVSSVDATLYVEHDDLKYKKVCIWHGAMLSSKF